MMAFTLSFLAGIAGTVTASPFLGFSPFSIFDAFESRSASISSGCSTTGPASCTNTSAVSNLCCFESPGGLLLQTQFWDTDPSTGPSNSWTIHGLWPDNCDLTYEESCDSSRDYTGISSLLTAQGASDTLDFMDTYWVDIDGDNEEFWEHEWSTHGTCMSTFETQCLPSGSPKGAEAVAYFQTVVKLFQTLPTYTWLSNQGIVPSSSTTHTLSALVSALETESGFKPSLDCDGSTISSISWYFHLKGSGIDGMFVPIDAPESGSCGSSGLKYPLKSGSPVSTTTTGSGGGGSTTSTTTSTLPTGTSLPAKATIHALQSGSEVGGLLSLGTWSTQTLATMTLSGTTSSFSMTSSKGSCGVSGSTFSCGSGVSTQFSAVTSGSNLLLSSGGSTTWSSTGTPSGETVYTVFSGSSNSETYSLVITSS